MTTGLGKRRNCWVWPQLSVIICVFTPSTRVCSSVLWTENRYQKKSKKKIKTYETRQGNGFHLCLPASDRTVIAPDGLSHHIICLPSALASYLLLWENTLVTKNNLGWKGFLWAQNSRLKLNPVMTSHPWELETKGQITLTFKSRDNEHVHACTRYLPLLLHSPGPTVAHG